MKKNLKNLALGTLAVGALWAGSTFYAQATPKKAYVENPKIQIENKSRTYAILANASGPSQPERFSEENANYSMLNILSFYKFLKGKGVDDKDITLLMYNPTNTDVFETKEYKSLEKKLSADILPSKKDQVEIDGEATRDAFLNAINNLHSNSNDLVYIVISNPSPNDENDNRIVYSKRNAYLEFDKETIFPWEINLDPKNGKAIIILNNGDAANFLKDLNKNIFPKSFFLSSSDKKRMNSANILAINSPEGYGLDKETFIMQLLNQTLIDKKNSIKDIISNLKNGQAYYFDGTKKSSEECPWINSQLIN